MKHSEKTKQRISAKLKGRLISDEKMKPLIYFHKKGRFYNTIINPMTLPIREKLRNKILELNKRGPREKVYA